MFFDDPILARVFLARHAIHWADFLAEQAKPVYAKYKLDIPVSASSTLLTIGRLAPVSQTEIARHLDYTHQTIAQQLRVLMKNGVVERRADPEDARAYRITLTRRGRTQYRRLEAFTADASKVFATLFEEVGHDLAGALTATRGGLEKRSLDERFDAHRLRAKLNGDKLCDAVAEN